MSAHRFQAAERGFAEAHAADPKGDYSTRYHARMAFWVDRLAPGASEALRLAARCQHIERWTLPRADYPDGRAGYLKWRAEQKRRHAEVAGRILAATGYDAETVARVGDLLLKRGLRHDAEVQVLEDAACLVFLELDLEGFAPSQDPDKLRAILRKTWDHKMSPAGREAALAAADALPDALRALVVSSVT